MFGGLNYNKLKTNLRLATGRLKLLGNKKTELTQKSRKEIADFISIHKEDRARIRVEQIIREDYFVEAFELLEMFCDLLLARFGLIEQMKELDKGLEEAVNSVLWAAARIQAEVPELKVISEQLTLKYGKPFAESCRENRFDKVNEKLLHKLSVQTPPKVLVEKYMMEIAKSHNVPFEPDPSVVMSEEAANAEQMLIDYQNKGEDGRGYGWAVGPAMGDSHGSTGAPYASPQQPQKPPPPPPNPTAPAVFNHTPSPVVSPVVTPVAPPHVHQGPICMHGGHPHPFVQAGPAGCPGSAGGTPGQGQPHQQQQHPFNYPNVKQDLEFYGEYKSPLNDGHPGAGSGSAGGRTPLAPPPYTTLPPFDHLPDGGSSPNGQPPQAPNPPDDDPDDLNFDDLNRRFEELKKKR